MIRSGYIKGLVLTSLLPSGIRPLKIHSDFEKAPEKAPWITFKITSNVQFWGAFRRLKDRITSKLPSEGPSKCEKESNLKVIPGAFSVYSKRNLKVIWGALFNVNYFDKEKRIFSSYSCVCVKSQCEERERWGSILRKEQRNDRDSNSRTRTRGPSALPTTLRGHRYKISEFFCL